MVVLHRSAGARIVAGAHRVLTDHSSRSVRGAVEARAGGLATGDWMDDDDVSLSFTRALSLPKLVLALEAWHMLTLRPEVVRGMFGGRVDAANDRNNKVLARDSWVRLRNNAVLSLLIAGLMW